MKYFLKHKKLIAIMLAIMVFVGIPFSALAAPNATECQAKILQAGDFDLVYDYDGPKSQSPFGISTHDENMNDVERELTDKIYKALLNHDSSIGFSYFKYVNEDWAMTMYSNVINDHPELYYVSHNYTRYNTGNYVTSIEPHYVMSKSEVEANNKIFYAGVNKALEVIDSSMDDMQKALAIHDYICENATYDECGDIAHSAFGFFKDGHIVCAGYALTFSYLMKQVGVECELITSRSMNHGWNVVKINGKWYHLDCTWDDSGSTSYGLRPDSTVNHHYFLKSLEYMNDPTRGNRSGIDTFDDCDAVDTTYDSGAWWEDVVSRVVVKNGYYYYLDPNMSSQVVYLKRRDKNGGEIKLSSTNFPCSSNNCARLTYLDNKLFVAAYQRIYSVNFDGTTSMFFTFGNKPCGLGVENNQLTYEINGAPNNFITINKWNYFDNAYTNRKDNNYNGYVDINADGYVNAKDYKLIEKQIGKR